nr:Nif3-like dinuclear metal center hexameric protein [Phytohalomonas tamaricis]
MEDLLGSNRFKDYTINGLQVEGCERLEKIMTGVTASQALLDEAVAWEADMVLVHHGYFWKNEPVAITGMKHQRIATLLNNDINLVAYHLPLDAHPELGNNAMLAKKLGWSVEGAIDAPLGEGILFFGTPDAPMSNQAMAAHIENVLRRPPLVIEGHNRDIRKIAWCTGGAQDMISAAADAGVDAFVSGEISERTTHLAREQGISYFSAGHHATERYGIEALGNWLAAQYPITHRFVDIDNPA